MADLTIEVSNPDTGRRLEYRLACLGDTATITGDEVALAEGPACLGLADPAVTERLVSGPPDDEVCTQQYGSADVARIVGAIDGTEVDTTVDRTDGCGIGDWDTLLASLLPAAES